MWVAAMGPGSSALEIIEPLVTMGILAGVLALGVFFMRRAASRRRDLIETSERAPAAPTGRARQDPSVPASGPEPPTPKGGAETPEAAGARGAPAAAAESIARVIPFPVERPSRPPPVPAHDERAAPIGEPEPRPMPIEAPAPKERAFLVPGLARTRSGFVAKLGALFQGRKAIDQALVEEIERVLLTADIGVKTSQKLLGDIRASLDRKELADPRAIWAFLRHRSAEILRPSGPPPTFEAAEPPFVVLVIGVNGSGKTTTIGKLAAKLVADGKQVVLGAGDTFRAAATEQLEVWAARSGAALVKGKEGADPSSVLFDALKKGRSERADVVIADTAGRLHTKTDLMDELQKVRRVLAKAVAGAPHETWLVIDSTQGQNAIAQARVFTEAMSVSGIVLTKLDGTAKGGVILGIADEIGLPVRYVGVGERAEDLRSFDADAFVSALYDDADGGGPAVR